jgi:hypothetical protein
LKRLLREVAASRHQEDGSRMTNAEVLARKLLERALEGNQAAQELVVDRVEGKAGRAAPAGASDVQLEEQIDRAAVAALNSLVPDEKGQTV